MGERGGQTIQFLTGEAMWPDRVNRRWPGAQFIARARIDRGDAPLPRAFATLTTADLWGVLIALPPKATGSGKLVTAITDLGASFDAWSDPNELLQGDAEAVVAAARYWELPWRYVGALRDAVAAQGIEILDEEPRDDAVTTAGG
jgi:hypothetical protein